MREHTEPLRKLKGDFISWVARRLMLGVHLRMPGVMSDTGRTELADLWL